MKPQIVNQLNLVLIGAGHSQIHVLKHFGMKPIEGLNIIIISDVLKTPYSGMVPGYIGGIWKKEEIFIDVLKLSNFAKANFIHTKVNYINTIKKTIYLEDHPPILYDILSINTGSVPNTNLIKGANKYAISVKPISKFIDKLPDDKNFFNDFAIIGGGKAGIELAFALRKKSSILNFNNKIYLIEKNETFSKNKKVDNLIKRKLDENRVNYILKSNIKSIERNLINTNNKKIKAKYILIVTNANPPNWIKKLDLKKDSNGFIFTSNTLQTLSYPEIFATGDVATINRYLREKSGVYSVKAGNILAKNIRAFILNKKLQNWYPQKTALSIISFSNGKALAEKGKFSSYLSIWFYLKKIIDKNFVNNFKLLPSMKIQENSTLPLFKKVKPNEKIHNLFCNGCGSKTNINIIEKTIKQSSILAKSLGASEKYMPTIQINSDYGIIKPSSFKNQKIIQSVDFISQHIPDPFIFGRISALHSLSDVFVAKADPMYALSMIALKRSSRLIEENELLQMLTGAILELSKHKTILIGGHTTASFETSLGFSITGKKSIKKFRVKNFINDFDLILTKPIGIGVILAGMMRNIIDSNDYNMIKNIMLQSNYIPSKIIRKIPNSFMTDITGFGLAYHAINLSQKIPYSSIELNISKIKFLSTALNLSNSGISSSLYEENLNLVKLIKDDLQEKNKEKVKLLFDPQTSGGILAAVPKSESERCLRKLLRIGYDASIIGKIHVRNNKKNNSNTLLIKN